MSDTPKTLAAIQGIRTMLAKEFPTELGVDCTIALDYVSVNIHTDDGRQYFCDLELKYAVSNAKTWLAAQRAEKAETKP